MESKSLYTTQKVTVKCPVYKNGRACNGVITEIISDRQIMVKIDGNNKSTKFATCWISSNELTESN